MKTYSSEDMFTAMCIWEYILENKDKPGTPLEEVFEQAGACQMRDYARILTPYLNEAWDIASADGYDECFDWVFVPAWIEKNVEWEHSQVFHQIFVPKPKPDYFHLGQEAERATV